MTIAGNKTGIVENVPEKLLQSTSGEGSTCALSFQKLAKTGWQDRSCTRIIQPAIASYTKK